MNKNFYKIKFYLVTILHFLVDGICAYTVFNKLYITNNLKNIVIVFVIYNSLAFLLQPLVGLIIDRLKKEKLFLTISLVMLLVGALTNLSKMLILALIGLANAIFHVVGGKYTIYASNGKMAHLGIFVSLGATGLVLGTYIRSYLLLIIMVILTAIIGLICQLLKDEATNNLDTTLSMSFSKKQTIIMVFLVCLAVLIRGLIGKASLPLFTTSTTILILIGVSSTIGKMIGGIIADKIGLKLTVIITLIFSLIGYLFFRNNVVIYLISTLLFNTTMPITLYLSNEILKKHEGLSFGLLAFMLFPGYLLGQLYTYLVLPYPPLIIISTILTISIIIYLNIKIKKEVS